MDTMMYIEHDIQAIHHTFLYKNSGQMSASQMNLTVLQNSNFSNIKLCAINTYRDWSYRQFTCLTVCKRFLTVS